MIDLIGKDPLQWEVVYTILGWGIRHYQGNYLLAISDRRAKYIIGMIQRMWIKPYHPLP